VSIKWEGIFVCLQIKSPANVLSFQILHKFYICDAKMAEYFTLDVI